MRLSVTCTALLAVFTFAAAAAATTGASEPPAGFNGLRAFPSPQVLDATLDGTRRPAAVNATAVQRLASGAVLVATGMADGGQTSVAAQVFRWDASAGRFAAPAAVTMPQSGAGNCEVRPQAVSGDYRRGVVGLFASAAHEGELWAQTAGGLYGVYVNTSTLQFFDGTHFVNLYTPSVTSSAAAINATHFAVVTTRGTSTLQPDSPLALGVFDTTARKMVGPSGGFHLPAKAAVAAGSCGSAACLFFDEANSALVAVVPGTRINATLALPLLAGAKTEQVTVAYDAALQRAVVYSWRTVYVVDVAATWDSISLHAAFGSHLAGGVGVARLLTRGSLAVGFEAVRSAGTQAALAVVNVSTGAVAPRVALASTVGTPTDVRLVGRMAVVTTAATAAELSNGTVSPATGVAAAVEGERVTLGAAAWRASYPTDGYAMAGVFAADPVTGAEAVAVLAPPFGSASPGRQWLFVAPDTGNVTYVANLGAEANAAADASTPPFVLPAPAGAAERTRLLVAPAARQTAQQGVTAFGWAGFDASGSATTTSAPSIYEMQTTQSYVDPATGVIYWAVVNSRFRATSPTFLASSDGLRATLPFSYSPGIVNNVFRYPGTPFVLVYGSVKDDNSADVVIVDTRTGRSAWHRHLPSGATWYFAMNAAAFAVVPPPSASSTAMELLRVTADGVTTVPISGWNTTDSALESPTALDGSETRVLFANTARLWMLNVTSASITSVAHSMQGLSNGVLVDEQTTVLCASDGAHVWRYDQAAGVNAVSLRVKLSVCAGPMFASRGHAYAFTWRQANPNVYGTFEWYLARLDVDTQKAALIRVANRTFNNVVVSETVHLQLFEDAQLVAVLTTENPEVPFAAMLDLINGTTRWSKTDFPTRTDGITVAASATATDGQLLAVPRYRYNVNAIRGVTATNIYTGETTWQLPIYLVGPTGVALTLLAPDSTSGLRHSAGAVGSRFRTAVTRVAASKSTTASTVPAQQPGIVNNGGSFGTFRALGISAVAAPAGFRPGDAPVFPATGDHTFAPSTKRPTHTYPPYNPGNLAPVHTMSAGEIAGITIGGAAGVAFIFGGFAFVMFLLQRRSARANAAAGGNYRQIDGPELNASINNTNAV